MRNIILISLAFLFIACGAEPVGDREFSSDVYDACINKVDFASEEFCECAAHNSEFTVALFGSERNTLGVFSVLANGDDSHDAFEEFASCQQAAEDSYEEI